jgi:hypothetical protein
LGLRRRRALLYAETNGYTDLGLTYVRDFSSDRFGVFGNATYRFNTY